jgi:hypothetical protein
MSEIDRARRSPPRADLWWARITCLSVFGPYVTGSARTEQVVVFVSFALILLVGWPRIMADRSFAPAPILAAWLGMYAVMLVGTVFRAPDPGFYGAQPASHALADCLLPVALMTLTWFWTLRTDAISLIRAVAPVAVVGMCANTAIEVFQLHASTAAVVGFLPRFWVAAPSIGSVAANAAGNGRFTGIFDQPAEAGIAYGLALFFLIWLARRCAIRSTRLVTVAAILLVTGGILTLSKVFLLGGAPLAALTAMRGHARTRVALTAACAAAGLWLAGLDGLLPTWQLGEAALLRLLHPGISFAAEYTAGRYGTAGGGMPVVSDVLRASPWAGFGSGGLDVPYDSLWIQTLILSGLLGVLLVASVMVMLVFRLLQLRGRLEKAEWHLAGAAVALAFEASLGIPSLTANRASTLLWLIIGMLVTARSTGPVNWGSRDHRLLIGSNCSIKRGANQSSGKESARPLAGPSYREAHAIQPGGRDT